MRYKILILEDQEITRSLCRKYLGDNQYEFVEASHGGAALDVLKSDQGINLIICDIGLPGMNGLEFCQHKAHMDQGAHVPVIALTGDHSPESIEEGKRLGIQVWLCKPFNRREFLDSVQRLLDI